ncbi:MAG: serine/threonine-protein kinase [Sandaracinus sp.]
MSTIDLSPGSLFAGQFRIVRPLAKGGMGAVYVVEQVATGRERALKLMHPTLVSDAKSIERFEREAQVGSRIESDHVVEVIAAGVEAAGPTPWICMELLRGETLADRLERGGIPSREVCIEIVKQLGHALMAAHRAGIVHRDLKPENIFLAESRREGVPFTLKVLDFGVATLTHGATDAGTAKSTQGVGSPLWMAPEQTNVGKVVLATDVWALGLIVYTLLTGQSYWRSARTPGSTITALLVEIMVEQLEAPSLRAREHAPQATLPRDFDAWFARCVTRDPSARFADASQALPPLLAMLSNLGQTMPEAFLATAAADPSMLPRSATTQPTSAQPASPPAAAAASHAFAATQPGPQLASGPQGAWQSGPIAHAASSTPSTPSAPNATSAPSASLPAAMMPVAAPRRRIWPWILAATVGAASLCGLVAIYQVVQTGERIAAQLETVTPQRVVDPESGATVELGPNGLHVEAPATGSGPAVEISLGGTGGPVVQVGSSGEQAEDAQTDEEEDEAATDEAATDEAATDDTAGDDAQDDDDDEEDAQAEDEEDDEADPHEGLARPRQHGVIGQVVAGMERRQARREARTQRDEAESSTADPAASRAFRAQVIDRCWRGTYEGEIAPPRARYVVHVAGSSIRVDAPRDTPAQQAFVRCVVQNAQGQPAGDYAYTLP